MEIAEEDEDEKPPSKRKSLTLDTQPLKSPTETQPLPVETVTLNADLASSPEQTKFSAEDTADLPTFVGVDGRPASADSFGAESSYTTFSYAYGKPKVKLGPRPSLEVSVKPQQAGNFRPVSAIPAGYKLFGKGSKRSKSKESNILASPQDEVAGFHFTTAPTSPNELRGQDEFPQRPTSSAGSIAKSLSAVPTKKTISPEKARLMKAMQLREKKKKKQQQQSITVDEPTEEPTDTKVEDLNTHVADNETTEQPDDKILQAEGPDDKDLLPSQADSGIALESISNSTTTDQTPDLTPSDSHPTTPTAEPSEPELSTKASSISESTDETVRGKDEPAKQAEGQIEHLKPEGSTSRESAAVPTEPVEGESAIQEHQAAGEEATVSSAGIAAVTPDEHVMAKNSQSADAADNEGATNIPVSKFSTNNSTSPITNSDEPKLPDVNKAPKMLKTTPSAQDLLAATRAAADPFVETPAAELAESPLANASEVPTVATAVPTEAIDAGSTAEPGQKRSSIIEPIRTDMAPPPVPRTAEEHASEAAYKSPVTPTFQRDASPAPSIPSTTPHSIRAVSNPVRGSPLQPADVNQSSARSISSGAAYLHKINQQQAGSNLAMKPKVGSSISQRIKALEMLSASTAEAPRPVSRDQRPQSTFFSVKKSEPAKAPSVLDRANSLRHTPSEGSRDSSPETSRPPPRDRSGSISNRLSMFRASQDDRDNHESISVTAKIIRDPDHQQAYDMPKDPSGFNPLDLKQSPLFVNHQKPVAEQTVTPLDSSVESLKDEKGRRSSMNLVRGLMKDRSTPTDGVSPSQSPPNNNYFSPRMSFSSRRSISKEEEMSRSPTGQVEPSTPGDDARSTNGDSKISRAGRFMRRLSTLSGSKSKTAAANSPAKSPPIQESPASQEAYRPSTTGTSPWIVSYLGDVNVQFPDNLLWKRRNMCLDSQGFLVLSALPAQSSRAAQGTKRFHLSEFRGPYCPDVEVQELPNSVVLDFVEGTSLQLACEDRSGQRNVLNSTCPFSPVYNYQYTPS